MEGMHDAVTKIETIIKRILAAMCFSYNVFRVGGTEVFELFSDFGDGDFLAPFVITLATCLTSMPRWRLEQVNIDVILKHHVGIQKPKHFEKWRYNILSDLVGGTYAMSKLSFGMVSECRLSIGNTSTNAPICSARKYPP